MIWPSMTATRMLPSEYRKFPPSFQMICPVAGSIVPKSISALALIGSPVLASRIGPDTFRDRLSVIGLSPPVGLTRNLNMDSKPSRITLIRTSPTGASSHRNRPSASLFR